MLDARGNPVGTRCVEALAAAETALWRMMSFYDTPLADLERAHRADPQWPLPLLMHAGFLLSLTEPDLRAQAGALLARALPLLARGVDREARHAGALRTLLGGDWSGACAAWESLLLDHPRDALALQWAHLFDFYRGDAAQLQQRVARVLPEWDEADPLHPYVLGLHAFGLEECQHYGAAEAAGRRALAGPARVPWAIHAVAHVMEMQGRHREGAAWMERWRGDWAEGNGFAGHLGWHQALFMLEALDFDAARDLFDAHLRADPAQITLQRVDAASLLWRLQLLGADVGSRWSALAAGWAVAGPPTAGSAFNDLHRLLALLGSGDLPAARGWVAASAGAGALAGAAAGPQAPATVGRSLMEGLLAFGDGRFDDAAAALYAARAQAAGIGGSHAQRDLITQTLLAAAARGTRHQGVGRALLNERRLAKPSTPLTEHWAAQLAATHPNREAR